MLESAGWWNSIFFQVRSSDWSWVGRECWVLDENADVVSLEVTCWCEAEMRPWYSGEDWRMQTLNTVTAQLTQTLLQSLQTLISSSFDHIYHPLTICFGGISPLLSTIFNLSNFILNCTQCRCWEDGGSCKCEVKMMIMPRLADVNHQEPHCHQSIGGHTEIFYLSVS